MPLYWILSTIMTILLFVMMLKVYGNYQMIFVSVEKEKNNSLLNLWYW